MIKQSFLLIAFLFHAGAAFALTDQSTDIRALMENGTLSQADCDRYHAGDRSEETTLRCGKFMFFYDWLGVPGFPRGLVDLLRNNAPLTVGRSLTGFGYIADPFSSDGLPLGLTPGGEQAGGFKGLTTTCASCHFGKVADGRYVVGQPNHNLDFAKLALTIGLMPEVAFKPKKALPDSIEAKTRTIWNEFFTGFNGFKVIGETIKLIPNAIASGRKPLNEASKLYLAKTPSGVLDALAAPAYEDNIAIPQRILPLWGMDPEASAAVGSPHGMMLTSSGGQANLQDVFKGVGKIAGLFGGKDYYEMFGPEYWRPLEAYIVSLKAPKDLAQLDSTKIDRGARIFAESCASCHNGPSYAGTRVFAFEEIGTDPNQAYFMDDNLDGKATEDLLMDSEITFGIKANRLAGIWSLGRYLHNGALSSLDELFCLNGPRPASIGDGFSTAGHEWTCNDYSREEKLDVIEFLRSL